MINYVTRLQNVLHWTNASVDRLVRLQLEKQEKKEKDKKNVWHVDLIISYIRFLFKYKIKTKQGLAINLCYYTTQ